MSEPAHESSSRPQPREEPAGGATTAAGDEELLAALADEFGARLRRRDHPKVEEYIARYPALEERIRNVLGAVAVIERGQATESPPPGEVPGTVIGRYRLLERIGEGGFGVVYLAEQYDPVRRKVALKLIKPGMDSRQVLARFEAERQALAIMDHPNIARVFDGGMTDSGRPYFVMELVKGVPITEFCDEAQLTPRQRLELFAQVCHAVQHAHQKGIIHRDIKPSNVLVIMHDATPVVKVIDFGVAKALGQELTDNTLFTGFAQLLGTPLYMSPEQAGQSALDVDTRSDIYSLGVLLYELLTGTTPFDKDRFQRAAQDEIRRIIREEEPPRPSTRLSASKDSLPSISAMRQTEPAKLTKLVRGELDWIVMKALEKDRNRRYETANDFAQDVQRYLGSEPVQAVPPSTAYRLRKLVRRNRGPVVAVSLVLLALVGGIIGTSLALRAEAARAEGERQASKEAQERQAETEAVLSFVESRIFAAARPEGQEGGLGHDVTLRRAIEAALPYLESRFADRPLVEARLRNTLGITFLNLGEARAAEKQFARARALYTAHLGPDHPDTLQSMSNLAISYADLGRHPEALKLDEEMLAARKRVLGDDHPDTLKSMHNLAASYAALGRHPEAVKLREETLAVRKRVLLPDHPDTLKSMHNLANSYAALDRHLEAVKLGEETLAAMKRVLPADHPDTLLSMNNLAISYAALGRNAEALQLREQTLAAQKRALPPDHPDTLASMGNLAASYSALGQHAEALKLDEQTLAAMKRVLPADHPDMLTCMWGVADSLVKLDRGAEAVPIIDECLARAAGKPVHPRMIPEVMDLRLRHFQKANDPAGCRTTATMWEKLDRRDAASLYSAACFRAVTSAVQAKAGGADAERLAREDADKAMAWLTKAVAAGYKDRAHMEKDADLDALRERADFRKLLAER